MSKLSAAQISTIINLDAASLSLALENGGYYDLEIIDPEFKGFQVSSGQIYAVYNFQYNDDDGLETSTVYAYYNNETGAETIYADY